jgi:hypothetical protein
MNKKFNDVNNIKKKHLKYKYKQKEKKEETIVTKEFTFEDESEIIVPEKKEKNLFNEIIQTIKI